MLNYYIEQNNLSFIETSALDASNVETAFQNILGGAFFLVFLLVSVLNTRIHAHLWPTEIYHIVSAKALDNEGAETIEPPRKGLQISEGDDGGAKQNKGCCAT